MRNTGIHTCGVIITPDDITNFVPVALAKDSDLFVTQFDNSVVESAGLLKMDFLGLSTLTLIKDTIENIKQTHGIELDAEAFPLDDKKTYELFQRGNYGSTEAHQTAECIQSADIIITNKIVISFCGNAKGESRSVSITGNLSHAASGIAAFKYFKSCSRKLCPISHFNSLVICAILTKAA